MKLPLDLNATNKTSGDETDCIAYGWKSSTSLNHLPGELSTVCTYRQITRSLFCLIFSEFVCVWKVLHLGVRIRWLCANDVTCEQMIFMTTTLSTSTLTLTSIRQHTTAADTHRNQRASGNRAHTTTMKHAKY